MPRVSFNVGFFFFFLCGLSELIKCRKREVQYKKIHKRPNHIYIYIYIYIIVDKNNAHKESY